MFLARALGNMGDVIGYIATITAFFVDDCVVN